MAKGNSKPVPIQNVEFMPWFSAHHSCTDEQFYIKVGGSVLLSEQFHALSAGAKYLYFCLGAKAGGKRGKFAFSQRDAKRYGISQSTMARRITELEKKQFVLVDRAGHTREYNYYQFTDKWKCTGKAPLGNVSTKVVHSDTTSLELK